MTSEICVGIVLKTTRDIKEVEERLRAVLSEIAEDFKLSISSIYDEDVIDEEIDLEGFLEELESIFNELSVDEDEKG